MRSGKLKNFTCILLCFCILFTGCGSKDDTGNNGNVSVTPTPISDEKITGEPKETLGDLDSEDLKVMPKEKSPSMYYYNVQELISENFRPDQDDKLGLPYAFNATVTDEIPSIVEYLGLNENYGKNLVGLDASAKGYKVMTKLGQAILIDVTPYQVKYIRDNVNDMAKQYLNGDLSTFDYFDAWYNNLKKYDDFPEKGATNRFYGFYFGYSEKDECPVFTYGVSELVRAGFFENNYLKYRNDKLKKYRYMNNFTFEYPVGWSDALKKSDRVTIYLPESRGGIVINDFSDDGMSIEDVVKMYLGETPDDVPPDPDMADMEPNFKVNLNEKVFIGDGTVSAYHINVAFKQGTGWSSDETIYLFKSKSSIITIQYYFYPPADNPDLTEPDELEKALREEIDAMIKTITLITSY